MNKVVYNRCHYCLIPKFFEILLMSTRGSILVAVIVSKADSRLGPAPVFMDYRHQGTLCSLFYLFDSEMSFSAMSGLYHRYGALIGDVGSAPYSSLRSPSGMRFDVTGRGPDEGKLEKMCVSYFDVLPLYFLN